MNRLIGLLMMCLVFAAAFAALAETGVVTTKDGRVLHGEIRKAADRVEITSLGKSHRIPNKDLKSVRMDSEIEADYEKRLAAAKSDDLSAQVELLNWTQAQGNPELVLRQANAVLRLKSDHAEAMEMKRKAFEAIKAERAARPAAGQAHPPARAGGDNGGESGGDEGDEGTPAGGPRKLTKAEINRIRFHELRALREKGREPVPDTCTVNIPRTVIEDFLRDVAGEEQYKGREGRERFLKLSPERKLAEIAVNKAGVKYIDKIEIKTDPAIFLEFKTKVLPIVMRGCASSNCHGGADAEKTGLRLFNDARRTAGSVYTNFVLLDEYESGKFAMIDRGQASRSLLLCWMMPPDQSPPEIPRHPGNAKIKPIFQNRNNPTYEALEFWIRGLRLPHPDYGVRLRPAAASASAPAEDHDEKMNP